MSLERCLVMASTTWGCGHLTDLSVYETLSYLCGEMLVLCQMLPGLGADPGA